MTKRRYPPVGLSHTRMICVNTKIFALRTKSRFGLVSSPGKISVPGALFKTVARFICQAACMLYEPQLHVSELGRFHPGSTDEWLYVLENFCCYYNARNCCCGTRIRNIKNHQCARAFDRGAIKRDQVYPRHFQLLFWLLPADWLSVTQSIPYWCEGAIRAFCRSYSWAVSIRPTDYRIIRALTNAANHRRSNPIPELVVQQQQTT